MVNTSDVVDGISSVFSDAPKLHELDDGEVARLKLGYFKTLPRDMEGVTVSFHFGVGTAETVERVADLVEPMLDKRKFRVSENQPRHKQQKSWDIGWVEVDKDAEIVDYEIDETYLKPTEK